MLAVSVSVGYDAGNMPKVFVDGKAYAPVIDCCGHTSGSASCNTNTDDYIRHSADITGPRILNIGVSDWDYLRPDGTYDWSVLDRRAKLLMEDDPKAFLMISIRFVYQRWAESHPEEKIVYGGVPIDPKSTDEWAGAPTRPSSASKPFRAAVFRDLAALAEHVRQASWGERMILVRPCYGVATEWFSYGTVAHPDRSRPMLRHFREFLRREYGSDAALQKAWKDPLATIGGVTIPTAEECVTGPMFIDVEKNRRTVDFNRAMADAMADLLIAVGNEIKRLLPGRIVGVYYGYVLNGWPGNSANFLLDRVMASGAVDFFSDPPDYGDFVRHPGGDFGHKTIASTLRRYGKWAVLEDDTRFHFMTNWTRPGWCMANSREDRVIVRRNILNTFFDREGYQVCDPNAGRLHRRHSFDDPVVLAAQKETFTIINSIRELPSDSGADMAFVVNYRDKFFCDSQCYRDAKGTSNPNWRRWWNLNRALPYRFHRTGAAFDLMTVDDLLASGKRYAKLVFMNGYALTPGQREGLKRLTRWPETTSVWFLAPGSITDDGFSDESMSDLTGLRLVGAGADPAVRSVDPDARELPFAKGWEKSLAKGAKVVFLKDVPNAQEPVTALVDWIGEHRYASGDVYVRRHGDYLMLHVGKPGRYMLSLPKRDAGRSLKELFTGRDHGIGPIELETDAPETWLFKLSAL